MSTLKATVQDDLHTAMRAQDKLRSGTLRMVLTAITMADELSDVKQEATRLHEELASTSHSFERSKRIELERTLAGTINGIAERLERIADRLEAE